MKHLILLFLAFTTYGSLAQQGEWLWVNDFPEVHMSISGKTDNGFVISGCYYSDSIWDDPPLTPKRKWNCILN